MKTKLRLGVIGAGAVVREIYQHLFFHSRYSDLLEVCAVADPDEAGRNWFGDLARLAPDRRFADYRELLDNTDLDVVQVNTPDHLHCRPAVDALNRGLDVVMPKPTAATVKDAHEMIQAARQAGRFLGVDFHKREDPRVKEAAARYQSGRYGQLQSAVFYMLDKLLVADPNHAPRFFASPDFAVRNSPVSFLTVHMADVLINITRLVPVQVRAIGYSHKLPSLRPISVAGFDVVDTEVLFDTGAAAHIITGWALPNTAWSTTVQSGRLLCSDGLVDLAFDAPGLKEIHAEGVAEINPLFRNFESRNTVTGYGVSGPGRIYEQVLAFHNGRLPPDLREAVLSPLALGFHTCLVLEGAERSLAEGRKPRPDVTIGGAVDLRDLAVRQLGVAAAAGYGLG